jgi:hypothetical protein
MAAANRTTILLWSLCLAPSAARAECPDEPGVSAHPTVIVEIVELDPQLPAPPCGAPGPKVRRPAATVGSGPVLSPMDTRPVFSLEAQAGYGGLWSLSGESVHGPTYGGMLSVTLGSWPTRGGVRLGGHYSNEMTGSYQPLLGSSHPAATRLGGATLTGFGEHRGLWLAVGAGLLVADTTVLDESPKRTERTILPELCFGAGYDLRLMDHLAIRLAVEGGTAFYLSWRLSASAGVVARF